MADFKPIGPAERVLITEPVLLGQSWLTVPNSKTKFTPGYEADLLFAADHPQRKRFGDALGRIIAQFKAPPRHKPTEGGENYADTMAAWALKSQKTRDFEWARPFTIVHTKAKLEYPPRLMVSMNGKWTENPNRNAMRQFFYGGVQVIADITLCGYEAQGGSIACYLNDIRSLNKGDAFPGMAMAAADRLSEVSSKHLGEVRDEDPSKGLDDEIPF